MKHIYQVYSPIAERKQRRRISVAEINILRKFEGSSLIEGRIERQLNKLHSLWFNNQQQQQR